MATTITRGNQLRERKKPLFNGNSGPSPPTCPAAARCRPSTASSRRPGIRRDSAIEGDDHTCWVLGRSDATLNRAGARLGSSDNYGALAGIEGTRDSLVIGIELQDGDYYMPLFVVLDQTSA